jgi:hypothetical protein
MANASDTSAGSKTDRVPFPEVFPILVLVILIPVHAMSYALYTGLGVPFPESVAALLALAAWLAAYAWFDSYGRRHGLSGVMGMGYFFYLAWWLLVPCYLLRQSLGGPEAG